MFSDRTSASAEVCVRRLSEAHPAVKMTHRTRQKAIPGQCGNHLSALSVIVRTSAICCGILPRTDSVPSWKLTGQTSASDKSIPAGIVFRGAFKSQDEHGNRNGTYDHLCFLVKEDFGKYCQTLHCRVTVESRKFDRTRPHHSAVIAGLCAATPLTQYFWGIRN